MHTEPSSLIRGGIVVVVVAVLVSVASAGVVLGAGGASDAAPGAGVTVEGAPAANGTVSGTVVDPDGNPAGGARVVAVDASVNAHRLLDDPEWWTTTGYFFPSTVTEVAEPPRAPGVYVAATGSGGDYALSLPPGTYTLQAYRPYSGDASAFVSGRRTVTVSAGEQRQVGLDGNRPLSIMIERPLYRMGVENASGVRSDTVEVPVEIDTFDYGVGTEHERLSDDVTGARATLTFNPAVAEAVAVEGADMTVTDRTVDNDAGTVSFDATSGDPVEEATLATVEFRLVSDRSTVTHLIPAAPTTFRTTDGSVSPTDDSASFDPNKGELVVEGDGATGTGPNVSRVAFEYANFGGSVNLEVNGDRRSAESFAALDGATVGGATVSVTPSTDSSPGVVTVTSPDGAPRITSFSLGGQELMVDGVVFGPSADPEATVEFGTLTPSQSAYAVGDGFASSPSEVRTTVEPYRFTDGDRYRDGAGRRVESLPEPFPSRAGAGFLPGNVNLRFNLTSVQDDGTGTAETVTITRHDPESGRTTNLTVERTDATFGSADPLLPTDLSAAEYAPPGTDAGYTDDKRRIRATERYPWSAVGQLRVGQATCSAVLVEDNHLLTSAHCVYDPSRPSPWASGGETTGGAYTAFTPGKDGDSGPFRAVTIASVQTYREYVETQNATYDIAVVTLASELGSRTGTFGYRAFPPGSDAYTDDQVHVTGYPTAEMGYVDTPDTQWDVIAHGRGTEFPTLAISDCEGTTACHELETGGAFDETLGDGNSGGPVWDTGSDGRPVVRSLFQGSAGQYSTAVRISDDRYSDVGTMIDRGNDVPLPPTARASTDTPSVVPGETVTLDAGTSADPNDDPLAYEWTQVAGPHVTLSDPDSATPEFAAPSVDGDRRVAFEVTVRDGTGRSDTARVGVSVTPADTTLRLEPDTRTVAPGERATYAVVVDPATDGVGAYDLEVSVGDPAAAAIVAASDETGGTARIDHAAEGSAVDVAASGGTTADGSDVVVATVTVVGRTAGRTTPLTVTARDLADETGDEYALTTATGATVRVFDPDAGPPVVGASERAARDPDADGVYEDVNGDGSVTPGDATVLFEAVFAGDPAVIENADLFDVNGDGSVTPGDASVLFAEAFGG